MAYNELIRQEAYYLHFHRFSYKQIEDELKKKYPETCKTLSEKTVIAWSKQEGWAERKKRDQSRIAERQNENRSLYFENTIKGLQSEVTNSLSQIAGMEYKSKEGGAFAVVALAKLVKDLTGEKNSEQINIQTDAEQEAFMKTLYETPGFIKLIEETKFQERLKANLEKIERDEGKDE